MKQIINLTLKVLIYFSLHKIVESSKSVESRNYALESVCIEKKIPQYLEEFFKRTHSKNLLKCFEWSIQS